jgi:hypothetical protein
MAIEPAMDRVNTDTTGMGIPGEVPASSARKRYRGIPLYPGGVACRESNVDVTIMYEI